jgi:hypothetical protein
MYSVRCVRLQEGADRLSTAHFGCAQLGATQPWMRLTTGCACNWVRAATGCGLQAGAAAIGRWLF